MSSPQFTVWPPQTQQQPIAAPQTPERPVFNPPEPASPGKFRCRVCQKWSDLGSDPATRLAELWPLWLDDWRERAGVKWDDPRPEAPADPGKVSCRHCDSWNDLGDSPQERLRELWAEWVDYEQERQTAAWRESPAYQFAGQVQMAFVAADRRDAQQEREVEAERDMRATARVRELIALVGLDPLTAHAQAAAEFPGW